MTTRNFDALFHPRSIALLGASNRPGSVGAVLARNLLEGGFSGALDFVNPRAEVISGRASFSNVAALPAAPDLAVIATPAPTVAELVSQLGDRGCRAAIVITAGDAPFRKDVLAAAWPHGLRVMGPNCLGFLSPVSGINASFAQLTPKRGELALVTQSGAIATAMLDWAHGRGIGFSHVLSLGDMVDVDFGDVLDYLALDGATSAILLYVEQITNARKFMSAARIAARAKPVIVVKAGRSAGGAKAAQSHTGALAGADNVYDAAFRRAGMLRVDALRDLFDAAQSLASGLRPTDSRLMIVTNGGGLGVLATDALEQKGAQLAELSSAGREALNAVLPAGWSHGNPVDIIGDANGARYKAALDIIAKETACDATLVMNCPTGVADNADCARAAAEAHVDGKPMLACWMGAASLEEPRRIFATKGIPLYETPEDAVGAFVQLADFAHNQRALLETPAPTPDRPTETIAKAQALIDAVLNDRRELFSAAEAKQLLALYGLDVAAARTAPDPASAAREATAIGGRVALKILSRDITHKSDVGGVALGVAAEDVQRVAEEMNARIAARAPKARLEGFTIEAMIQRPLAHELRVGASVDPTLGPVIMFGHGGVAVEVIADTAIALPPLNSALARDLIRRTRVSRLLAGYRDRPAANLDAVCQALIAVSDLLANHPEIQELDINPLLADAKGAIAIDARVVVRRRGEADKDRLAIAPYPSRIEHNVEIAGETYAIRPLRPQDAPALLDLGARTSASDIRLRFHGAVRVDDALGAARLSQLDYDREMALAAIDREAAIAGVARVHFDPQIETGEFAVLVRTDLQRRGLGRALLCALINYARGRGAASITGDILPGNTAMLALAHELGAEISMGSEDAKRVSFQLS